MPWAFLLPGWVERGFFLSQRFAGSVCEKVRERIDCLPFPYRPLGPSHSLRVWQVKTTVSLSHSPRGVERERGQKGGVWQVPGQWRGEIERRVP